MQLHPHPDDLALIALGDSLGGAADAHVAGCAQCSAELESFRLTVGLAELSNYGEEAPMPGEHVWQSIATELGFAQAERSSGSVATAIGRAPVGDEPRPVPSQLTTRAATGLNGSATPSLRSVAGTGDDVPAVVPPSDATAPTPIGAAPSRRRARWVAPLAAAVVGIAVGAGAVVISQHRSDDVTVEAIAPLTPVVGGPLTADQQEQLGKAELVAAPTGQEVRVLAPSLPPSSNDYEVWLFGNDGRMVSLGTLNDGSGTFTVPQGISTQEYRVVDVSDEPPDGNPAHSGVSLVRGKFS